MLRALYEHHLLRQIRGDPRAHCLLLVIEETDLLEPPGRNRLLRFARWCRDLGITPLVHVGLLVKAGSPPEQQMAERLRGALEGQVPYILYTSIRPDPAGNGGEHWALHISLGFGGREELTRAIQGVLQEVQEGKRKPEEIDEQAIEKHLVFPHEPDLILRASGRLTDFLLWQSIYSELYFTEVSWNHFRRMDLLRALRDYQKRQRRYGK
ncbi:MAG: undecaprenyl diphosphate synthase family protein [Euryarchaeota archaeon]|nr:undecaprenyl diphosphate synthase family protein [Euryarchaeota archaeon]